MVLYGGTGKGQCWENMGTLAKQSHDKNNGKITVEEARNITAKETIQHVIQRFSAHFAPHCAQGNESVWDA